MTNTRLAAGPDRRFRSDVISGLSLARKRLPSKYFYDAAGSRLFDRITRLPEYYPTRTELKVMRTHAPAMAARCGPRCQLIELGAGTPTKVRLLLDHLEDPEGYVPVDVSGAHLREAAAALAADYPTLDVEPVVADFTAPFDVPDGRAERRVAYFPGSTIGNFDPPEADALLRRIARLVGPGGGLLLGVDLRKDVNILERAYNDSAGVTAEFNRNLLVRIDRELGGNFRASSFRHLAFYDAAQSRIEMHLVSDAARQVRVGSSTFDFRAGETIHTENSYKYDVDELAARALDCGLRLEERWTDDRGYFAVLYLTATGLDRSEEE
ncbi:L-histidine N(alpha)-methyltransferase [Aquisphaera insulae]|uniref:L-histidine N(alpha)-methyltransferase n=1 Tax=Aquisphaera insulae TaxID=2712864 RepID=UPI0013EAC1B1|nr:L-histidine N(alpha)-methyltransferase [Aquisphaera insulae]